MSEAEYSNLQEMKKILVLESRDATPERKKEIRIQLMDISLKQALIRLEEKFPRNPVG